MAKSNLVNEFFSKFHQSKKLFNTDDLIGVFKFYPKSDHTATIKKRFERIHLAQDSLTNRFIKGSSKSKQSLDDIHNDLEGKIKKKMEELREISNETKKQIELNDLQTNMYKEQIMKARESVCSMDKTVKITSPNFDRFNGSAIYHSRNCLLDDDVFILDGTPLSAIQLFRVTLLLLQLHLDNKHNDAEIVKKIIMNQLSISHHMTLMRKISFILHGD